MRAIVHDITQLNTWKKAHEAISLMESYHLDTQPLLTQPFFFPGIPSPSHMCVTDDSLWRSLMFPHYFNAENLFPKDDPAMLESSIQKISQCLLETIQPFWKAYCLETGQSPQEVTAVAERATDQLMQSLGRIRESLKLDIMAAKEGDPAVKSVAEVIHNYPFFRAILMHRIAHELYNEGVPIVPRMLSERVHSQTGIDIHPGAEIGYSFFIDHGTGVVVGETAEIGNHVRLYQNVTLGALSLSPEKVKTLRATGQKRHPTIEDYVVVYAGATILGGDTIIGHHSVIGGNAWLTKSVEPYSRVYIDELLQQKVTIYNSLPEYVSQPK